MHVVQLASYGSRETIKTLETLLRDAKKGRIKGLVFGCYDGSKHPYLGVAGHYRRNTFEAIGVTHRILTLLHEQQNDMEG